MLECFINKITDLRQEGEGCTAGQAATKPKVKPQHHRAGGSEPRLQGLLQLPRDDEHWDGGKVKCDVQLKQHLQRHAQLKLTSRVTLCSSLSSQRGCDDGVVVVV